MALKITDIEIKDVRFPTSQSNNGSDAMNKNPDHSLACAVINTTDSNLQGFGITFTIGAGTEIITQAILSYSRLLIGRSLEDVFGHMGQIWQEMVGYSPLRWLGPEKGVVHLATAALNNALWDLYAKVEQKPLWKLLVDMHPQDLIRSLDLRYLSDVLTQDEALSILEKHVYSKVASESALQAQGYPAYTTSAGWIGYSDAKLEELIEEKLQQGWTAFKIKVGQNFEDDIRRLSIVRNVAGPNVDLMLDANQVWDVTQAIENMQAFSRFNPLWIEEPTSPDDIVGHARIANAISPIGVATGEHCHNRVMFKQFFQLNAMQYCQLDACRLGGISEALVVVLLAAKFNVPVCPHAGALGLREVQQHLSIFDYIAVTGSMNHKRLEYADSFDTEFITPARVKDGRYQLPVAVGLGVELRSEAYDSYEFPRGNYWAARASQEKTVD